MRVLDGCGTGSITAEIAAAVGPEGSVVGLDRDASLIETAREAGARRTSRSTWASARAPARRALRPRDGGPVLQWVAKPGTALVAMVRAARSRGVVEVLDYDHERVRWEPEPPLSVRRFCAAFPHRAWARDAARLQALHLVAVEGRRPA